MAPEQHGSERPRSMKNRTADLETYLRDAEAEIDRLSAEAAELRRDLGTAQESVAACDYLYGETGLDCVEAAKTIRRLTAERASETQGRMRALEIAAKFKAQRGALLLECHRLVLGYHVGTAQSSDGSGYLDAIRRIGMLIADWAVEPSPKEQEAK